MSSRHHFLRAGENTPADGYCDEITSPSPTTVCNYPATPDGFRGLGHRTRREDEDKLSRGTTSALGLALFGRKSPCCFEVFVNYFFLSAGQTWLVPAVFHGVFAFSLRGWTKNSEQELPGVSLHHWCITGVSLCITYNAGSAQRMAEFCGQK